ncbi:hypothetical protein HYDPIDRAFT_154231 [Hydnomerulius pinastri MD-312]|uniref:Uncharacterized protein n=1 Tax=Hydnomerulius pinastri MD-312 TaxID=994086 RepID=A0A0C9W152_9AGAM|nr:hypothetical protein HYDPIDRAFT_154231 [Hydnomerulius pinastri MD-312]
MSATPLSNSEYASPLTATSSLTSLPSTSSKVPPKPKPVNVFSNDGSFLERLQRNKKEEEDKRKAEEALAKKRHFVERFRNRGKRPPPDSSPAVTSTDSQESPAKKAKVDNAPLTDYQKEVRDYAGRSLKDTGTGVRPLVK